MKPLQLYLLIFCAFGILFSNAQISTKHSLKQLWSDSVVMSTFEIDNSTIRYMSSLYAGGNFKPIFSNGMGAMYLDYLRQTELWGFNPEKYNWRSLDSLFHANSPLEKAIFDIQATQSYLMLYDDILNGVLKNEKTRGEKIHFKLEKMDTLSILNNIHSLPSINHLKLAEPQIAAYQKSKQLVEHYSKDSLWNNVLVFKDTLQLGDRDTLVISLREKLYFLGDLKVAQRLRSPIFDKDVLGALNDFKTRHLLSADSLLDEETVKYLNTPIQEIISELQLNLERWKWLPNGLGYYYAYANLPAFEMSLVKNDTLLMRQKIVCGKVSRSTPAFSDTMRYMDINPTWTVPPTILQKDVIPKAMSSSSYLSITNMKVLEVSTGKYVNSSEINWANSKNYKFVQGPGLSNSLGVVKFIFPNPYYIFFHDTPHKEHFPLPYRAYSSGCIRLQHPRDFAELLLQFNDVSYTRAEIDSIVDAKKTKRILLNEKPVVYITYLTQDIQDGLLFTYPDVYGYNEELEKNLKVAQGL